MKSFQLPWQWAFHQVRILALSATVSIAKSIMFLGRSSGDSREETIPGGEEVLANFIVQTWRSVKERLRPRAL